MSASITPPAGMVECDNCDGFGNAGLDEAGRPYTCYRCCMTGWMLEQCQWEEPQVYAPAPRAPHFMERYPLPLPVYPLTDGYRAASFGLDDDIDIPF